MLFQSVFAATNTCRVVKAVRSNRSAVSSSNASRVNSITLFASIE